MTFRLIIRQSAERDLAEASEWYEHQLSGLGSRFLLSVDASLARITRIPEAYAPCFERFRRALVRRFPYGIYFFIEEKTVIVIAVLHLYSNPQRIQRILEKH
jgi:plasmid stabilization system protein ParE